MAAMQRSAAERQKKADEIAAQYDRWTYGEGYQAGKVDGGRTGWKDGYQHGFDVGAETGGARVLLELRAALGDDVIDRAIAGGHLPHTSAFQDYRARTAYQPVAGREEWRGLENGAQLPTWDAADDDTAEL